MEPVIVAGAGPVGLALALALARRSVPSVVLDSGDGEVVRRAARTCVLRPQTAALLPGVETARWRVWRTERRRQCVARVELDDETSPLHVEQYRLEHALREALADEKLVRIATGSRLDTLEQDAEGVTAHTRGPGGTWWRGSYLVGCDGARSTVRKLLGVGFAGRTSVERYAVAAVRTRLPRPDEALLHRDPGGRGGELTARPLPHAAWRLDWLLPPRGELVTPEEMLDRVHATLALLHQGSADDAPPAYELLDTGVYATHQRLARRWRVQRAFLAGDAAHLAGALGVQNVDEGLRDAANLAWKLALAWHHGARGTDADEALLDSYSAERRAAVGARLRAVDQALPFVRRGGGGLRTLLPGGGAGGPLGLLTDGHLGRGPLGCAPVYDRSPLAVDGKHAVRTDTAPGEPVRDVPVVLLDGTRARLRERLGGRGGDLVVALVAPGTGVWASRHWLRAGLMPELAAAVEALPLAAELVVTEEYPGATAHTVLAVRPDGHLAGAFHGARPEALRACARALTGAGA
ncbi:monooxygenase [Streptomyces sp. RKND-216]|uniref:FAD-dependent monooxygenase n=1 Tax=Streptomyces sp. RKND-216 TaxID=2562581 RepID=UPI00109D8FAA|nr:FAD-dependent monooxygenase [Streptomyces sp. RKND-216]THA24168.1 monooxygenase [Streptomyces sp. RKND-216]